MSVLVQVSREGKFANALMIRHLPAHQMPPCLHVEEGYIDVLAGGWIIEALADLPPLLTSTSTERCRGRNISPGLAGM